MVRKKWTHDELILAFNLYCKTSFGQIHNRNPDIIELAKLIGRTASAVSWKLANFARLDPLLIERGISGATHGSKGEVDIWNKFNGNWDELSYVSESLLAKYKGRSIEDELSIDSSEFPMGKDRETRTRVRVNQNFFRSMILAAYSSKCCITGLPIPSLLVASHIVPWSVDANSRTNPHNGLCLNAIHDRAFDRGLLTITVDYRVKLSSKLITQSDEAITQLITRYEDKQIDMPTKFAPDLAFIEYHNQNIFKE